MAFIAKNFVICSRFPLFRANGNLWMYKTMDTLDSILADVDADGYSDYFMPRKNLKNHDSADTGDVILMFVENDKLVYLKVVGKKEAPYKIKVARTYLENEATLLALITELQLDKASKPTDFATPITEENLGITQAEQEELEDKIDTAANSGRMITPQGFWYAKMHSETVAPSAEDGTNYADFSQTDGQGNPVIVTYNRVSGAWVQDQTITPPADYDGYVQITSKIWDITEQDGQQGGRILWNHTSKQFTPYPNIVSFDSIEITGDSTVDMPATPTDDNIANVGFVKNTIGAARNIGDIFFTMRKDTAMNGAVECNGNTYNTADFSGAESIGDLLALGKVPYVSLATYATLLSTNGSVGVFGWDGIGTTAFRVPSLNDIFIETGTAAQIGDYIAPGLPDHSHDYTKFVLSGSNGGGSYHAVGYVETDNTGLASVSNSIYGNSNTVQPNTVRYRAMVQLAVSATDEALETCTAVTAQVAANTSAIAGADYVVESQLPTALNNYTWYRKYKSGWVEQGGQHVPGTSSDIDHASNQITLPITMADTHYSILTSQVADTGGTNYYEHESLARRTSTTTISVCMFGQIANDITIQWEVKGMAA